MDSLIRFRYNKCLFKCDPHMFNNNMKNVLTKLFSKGKVDSSNFHIFHNYHGTIRCIICLQMISTVNMIMVGSPFMICSKCCYVCNAEFDIIRFYALSVPGYIGSTWIIYDKRIHKYVARYEPNCNELVLQSNIKNFICHSHKLIHRFFHTTPIIFLLSITDINSHCNQLNLDVMIHIFKFIY